MQGKDRRTAPQGKMTEGEGNGRCLPAPVGAFHGEDAMGATGRRAQEGNLTNSRETPASAATGRAGVELSGGTAVASPRRPSTAPAGSGTGIWSITRLSRATKFPSPETRVKERVRISPAWPVAFTVNGSRPPVLFRSHDAVLRVPESGPDSVQFTRVSPPPFHKSRSKEMMRTAFA